VYKRQIYQIAESNRIETFFRPNWNALIGNRYSITVPFCEFCPVLMNIDLSAFVQEVKLILLVD